MKFPDLLRGWAQWMTWLLATFVNVVSFYLAINQIFSTLIVLLSLVKMFHGIALPALLCHEEPANAP